MEVTRWNCLRPQLRFPFDVHALRIFVITLTEACKLIIDKSVGSLGFGSSGDAFRCSMSFIGSKVLLQFS